MHILSIDSAQGMSGKCSVCADVYYMIMTEAVAVVAVSRVRDPLL